MTEISTGMMVFVRCGAMLLAFPVFSSPQFPIRLRIALALMVSVIVTPGVANAGVSELPFWDLVIAFVQEALAGLLMGGVAKIAFHALELFAGLVGVEIGLNTAAVLNPLMDSRTEAFGTLTYLLGAMLLFTLDLHHWMLGAFQSSFKLLPLQHATLSMPLYHDMVGRTSQVFQSGLIMAAPVMAISFLISLIFAMLNRAVPSMNVFAESFGFRILAGLLVFGLTLNLTAQHAANYLRRLPDDLAQVARLLSLS